MSDTDSALIWDKAKYKLMGSLSIGNFSLSSMFEFVSVVVSLINGLVVFILAIYQAIPRFVESIADLTLNITSFFSRAGTEISQSAEDVNAVVTQLGTIQQAANGQSVLDFVLYMLNLEMAADGFMFVVGISFVWFFIVIWVLGVATALLLSGTTIYVSRKGMAYLTIGAIDL